MEVEKIARRCLSANPTRGTPAHGHAESNFLSAVAQSLSLDMGGPCRFYGAPTTLMALLLIKIRDQSMCRSILILCLSIFSWASFARATVITFEELTSPGGGVSFHGTVYSSQGYDFKTFTGGFGADFATYHTGNANYPGSTALFAFNARQLVTLSRSDGGSFNLDSIDLAEYFSCCLVPRGIEFSGTKPDLFVVRQTLNLGSVTPSVFDLETFAFSSDLTT